MEKGETDPKHLPAPKLETIGGLLALVNALHQANPLDRARLLVNGLSEVAGADHAGVWVKTPPDHFETVALTNGAASAGITLRTEHFVEAQRALRSRSPIVLCRPESGRRSIVSLCCHTSDHSSVLGIWRERSGFEEYHRTILYLIHPQVHWILEKERTVLPELPISTRSVLDLMLTGLSEKAIARRMDRSVHTVHSHVKRVYRHYNVRSRAELMLKFFDRTKQNSHKRQAAND